MESDSILIQYTLIMVNNRPWQINSIATSIYKTVTKITDASKKVNKNKILKKLTIADIAC